MIQKSPRCDSLSYGIGLAPFGETPALTAPERIDAMHGVRLGVVFMDMEIHCPRCGNLAAPAGHEDGRAFYQCENCDRVWMTFLTGPVSATGRVPLKVLVVDDSFELLGLITAWLEQEGFVVFT